MHGSITTCIPMEHRRYISVIIKVALIVLHFRGSPVESVRKTSVLAGADVTLNCLFDKPSKPVQLNSFTVEWNVVNDKYSEKKRIVYTIEDGTAHVNREGSVVDKAGLFHGNASLQLCNLTVRDEGVYTCRVITPVMYTETTPLEVSARPSVFLPEIATVTVTEREKTLRCDIMGFYPEKLDVMWLIQNGSRMVPAGNTHLTHVCTEMAVLNADGTYSISSGITVHSSAVEGGETHIICQIQHSTYHGPYSKSVRLTVQAPNEPGYNAVTLIAASSVTSLLLVIVIIGSTLLLYKYFHTVPPSVSDILKPSITYAKVPTELKCTIKRIRQRELKVKWYKVTANRDLISVSNSQSERDPMLAREDVSDQATLQSESRCHVSTLSVCLTVSEDQTTFQCVVLHRGKKITRETTVSVKVEPSFLQISSIPQIPKVERLLVLCCRVEKFYPEDVHLEWSRNDGEQVRTVTHYGPFSDHERLHSVWSKIELIMAREDERAVYTCRVYHSSFPGPGYKDALYHINTQGSPPNVMLINCEPPCPLLDEECTLNLCVEDFSPEDVYVTWSKNGEEVLTGVFNTPPSLTINGLYSMWSFLKLTLGREDQGAEFRCQVVHSAQREPEERVLALPHLLGTTANGCA